MRLSTSRYSLCVCMQLALAACDLLLSCASLFPRGRDSLLVIFVFLVAIFSFQDLLLVLSITMMLMTFFSTYLFQAGLVEVLVRKFRAVSAAAGVHLALSVALHAVWLLERWDVSVAPGPSSSITATPAPASHLLLLLFTLQRCFSPWYYFCYKRSALRVSDPRLYEDLDWVDRQLRPR